MAAKPERQDALSRKEPKWYIIFKVSKVEARAANSQERSLSSQVATSSKSSVRLQTLEAEERSRGDQWHWQYAFSGVAANEEEKEAEGHRRRQYEAEINLERLRERG